MPSPSASRHDRDIASHHDLSRGEQEREEKDHVQEVEEGVEAKKGRGEGERVRN